MNRYHIPLCLAVVAGAALMLPQVAAASPSSVRSQSAALKSLMLRSSELGGAYGGKFTVLTQLPTPNSVYASSGKVTGLKVSDVIRAGRISGYAVISSGGALEVVNGLDQFKTSSGPRFELQFAYTHRPTIKGFSVPKQHISTLGGVGDQAISSTSTVKTPYSKTLTNVLSVVFLRGRYLASVTVETSGAPSLSNTVKLAQIMDNRLQQNG